MSLVLINTGGVIDDGPTALVKVNAGLSAIDAEIAARASADTALRDRIDAEAAARTIVSGTVATLSAHVDAGLAAEAAARTIVSGAVAALSLDVDGLGQRVDGLETASGAATAEAASASDRADAARAVAGQALIVVNGLQATVPLNIRPGDDPDAFTTDLASGIAGVPPNAVTVTSPFGRVLRVTGSVLVASLGLRAVEPDRLYKVRAVLSRAADSADPTGAGLRVAVAWYGADRAQLGVSSDVAVGPLTVAMGRRVFGALVSTSSTIPGAIAPPAGAVYARPYVRLYGEDPVTDVEVIEHIDVTDADLVSIDIDDLTARTSAIEAAQRAVPAAIVSESFLDALYFG